MRSLISASITIVYVSNTNEQEKQNKYFHKFSESNLLKTKLYETSSTLLGLTGELQSTEKCPKQLI